MIKINRAECPDALKDSPSEGTHYNKEQVVKPLWKMQHEKCCYCEMKIPEKGHLKAVEHFHPKSVFKGLKNDWLNLLLACAQCNGKKSDKFPVELTDASSETKVVYIKSESGGEPQIIDPSDPNIDPEEHIDFIVEDSDDDLGLIKEKNNSRLGHFTIEVIGLDNYFYTKERRYFYINILAPHHLSLLQARDQNEDDSLEQYTQKFKMLMSAKGKLAAFARAFAKHKKLHERFEIDILTGSETA